jgi:hypothetical protein
MDQDRVDPHGPQRAHAADAEHPVLGQPHVAIPDVEARRDPAIDGG